jgi:hypothetical protein
VAEPVNVTVRGAVPDVGVALADAVKGEGPPPELQAGEAPACELENWSSKQKLPDEPEDAWMRNSYVPQPPNWPEDWTEREMVMAALGPAWDWAAFVGVTVGGEIPVYTVNTGWLPLTVPSVS